MTQLVEVPEKQSSVGATLRRACVVAGLVALVVGMFVAVSSVSASVSASASSASTSASAAGPTASARVEAEDSARAVAPGVVAAVASSDSASREMAFGAVECGTNSLMTLSCSVVFNVAADRLTDGATTATLCWSQKNVPAIGVRGAKVCQDVTVDSTSEYSSDMVLGARVLASADESSALTSYVATIHRMRPNGQYAIELFDSDHALQAESEFSASLTGISSDIDAGVPLATVSGKPNYELLLFSYAAQNFRGIVAVDTSGFLVWYANVSQTSPYCLGGKCKSTPNSHVEAFAKIESGDYAGYFCVNNMVTNAAYQGVSILAPDGTSVANLAAEKLPTLTNQFGENVLQGHECRPTPEGNILITGYVSHVINGSDLGNTGSDKTMKDTIVDWITGWKNTTTHYVDNHTAIYVAHEYFLEWNPKSDVVVKVAWVNDMVPLETVVTATHMANHTADRTLDLEWSTLGDDVNGLKYDLMYLHLSSVSVSWDEKYFIVCMRDANTVVAVDRVSLTMAWSIGSSLPRSDFSFDAVENMFYQPHDGKLFAPDAAYSGSIGTLCLIDDGSKRPDCQQDDAVTYDVDDDGGCYSRAICYALDFARGTADKVYQFAYPVNTWANISDADRGADIYNLNGGAVQELNGGYLVAFTSTYKTPFSNYSWAFQTTADATVQSIIRLPHVSNWNSGGGSNETIPDVSGLYRVEAIPGISDERYQADWV